jgi:hypothetical protein
MIKSETKKIKANDTRSESKNVLMANFFNSGSNNLGFWLFLTVIK